MNRKVLVQLWTAKNLDNPFGNALKDAVLSIAEARASGDYAPDKWFESFLIGSGNSLIASGTEKAFRTSFDIADEIALNPIQKIGLNYASTYISNVFISKDFNPFRPIQGVITDYFLDQHIYNYSSWSHLGTKFTKPLPKIR